MVSRRSFALGLLASGVARAAFAAPATFNQWLDGVRRDALAQGIHAATLDRALGDLQPIPRVIELDRRQPETTLTFGDYISRVVSPQRREDARAHVRENRALLDEIGARYSVDPRFIVALWGIETDFGRTTGGYPVIAALATLAFDGRRPDFFRRELMNALLIVDRQHIDPQRMMGSWAGAMGQSQFMPSSFLAYAVSYRGDGPPDIWTRREDVFASIANYLARCGWRKDESWGEEVALPQGFAPTPGAGPRPLGEWTARGLTRVDGSPLAATAGMADLVTPAGQNGPYFLTYDNYRVLLKWNNSSYFAIAVGFLADAINRR
ncbi:MAG TPA: lytic murein transglycosylase [Stellaceae bacterium]|nr:lytic murein transglycosylase [Stellaceae bacterium]